MTRGVHHVNKSCSYSLVGCANITLDFTLKPPDGSPGTALLLPALSGSTKNPSLTSLASVKTDPGSEFGLRKETSIYGAPTMCHALAEGLAHVNSLVQTPTTIR